MVGGKNEFYLGGTLVIERAVNGSEDMRYFDLIDAAAFYHFMAH
jgi:hypothetical protein